MNSNNEPLAVGDLVVVIKNLGGKEFDYVIGTHSKITKIKEGIYIGNAALVARKGQVILAYWLEAHPELFCVRQELKKIRPLSEDDLAETIAELENDKATPKEREKEVQA